jgi:uncharacterized protein (DUF1800 family)
MQGALLELIRFGYGPLGGPAAPALSDGVDPDRLLASLDTLDPVTRPGTPARLALLADQRRARDVAKAGGPKDDSAVKALRQMQRADAAHWVTGAATAPSGFRERLVNFWANRLTVAPTRGDGVYFVQPYRDEVVRPHVAGRFAAMLAAAAWHPAMLLYLDQARSVGPNSAYGLRRRAGLNENFAREFLELHSMGAGYAQADVTELARLLAGLNYAPEGAVFDPDRAEPGPKTVLGADYGTGPAEIARFIEALALRPETADSVALALARHFLADDPPAALVAQMAAAYLDAGSALPPVYRVLLEHPAAADPVLQKLRSPHEYVVASLRAFGLTGAEGPDQGGPKGGLKTGPALQAMGQPVFRPQGPDGWPDRAGDWITPPFLTARLDWAEKLARLYAERAEPAALARHLLGDAATDTIRATGQAEQRWEGVAVLLGSPAFMRR